MEFSKIHLSESEVELMQNADVILTKNRVMASMKEMLESLRIELQSFPDGNNSSEVLVREGKISRGENYKGLPYLILDYPRLASEKGMFFVRCFFWWGNYFSITLQISGLFKERYERQILSHREKLSEYKIFIGEDPWVHDLNDAGYQTINMGYDPTRNEFIKIARSWPLGEWNQIVSTYKTEWKKLMALCELIS